MKLADVVAQLQLVLPKYTNYFSDSLDIESISATANLATIKTTAKHRLENNDAVTISNVSVQTGIASITQDGLVFTVTTDEAHDITFGYPGYENITLGGFVSPDTDWNSSFKLIAVTSRLVFKIQSTNTLPTLVGAEYITEKRIDGVNGRFAVTVIDTLTFSVASTFHLGTYIGGTVKTAVRIAGSVSIKRSIEEYTEQDANDLWMFVSMRDASVSKDRNAYNDAVSTIVNGEALRLRLIDGFSVFLVKNVSEEIAAVDAIDICRHDLLTPILKSLFGAKFDTGLSNNSDFIAILTGHNSVEYDRATFIYQYVFEFSQDIVLSDSVENEDTRAFNDISYTHTIGGDDTDDMTIDTIEIR